MAIDSTLQQELIKLANGRISFNELLREHTTIKIGGPADIWFEPADELDLQNIIRRLDENNIPRMILGLGSNTLIRNGGVRGAVINLSKFDHIKCEEGDVISAGAGAKLSSVLAMSVEHSLTGLECTAGIPGTVGGALFMNAGTNEGSIGDAVFSVKWINKTKLALVEKKNLQFSYRKLKLPHGVVIISANFQLKAGDKTEIERKIEKIRSKRKETQPLLWPSLGSVFKNPAHGPKAWTLIDSAGLRGVRVGGARISNEHANWIINEGKATAKDVEVLIKMIREKVKEEANISLETEINIVGETS